MNHASVIIRHHNASSVLKRLYIMWVSEKKSSKEQCFRGKRLWHPRYGWGTGTTNISNGYSSWYCCCLTNRPASDHADAIHCCLGQGSQGSEANYGTSNTGLYSRTKELGLCGNKRRQSVNPKMSEIVVTFKSKAICLARPPTHPVTTLS